MTWRSVDGYALGRFHRDADVPATDRCEVGVLGDGHVVVAVLADGSSGAAQAERGAEIVCAALMDAIANDVAITWDLARLGDAVVRSWVAAARAQIAGEADQHGCEPSAYAASALACVASDAHTICLQIGAGAIVVRLPDGDFSVAIGSENASSSVTDDDALDRITVARFARIDDLAVLSAGLAPIALDLATHTADASFFEPLTTAVRALERSRVQLSADLDAYLASDAIRAHTTGDAALAIAVRLPA
jgi:hypothetical protein